MIRGCTRGTLNQHAQEAISVKLTTSLFLGMVLTLAGAGFAQDAAHDVDKAAKVTGQATKTAAKETAKGTEKVADKTASGTEDVAKKTGSGVKKGAKGVGYGVKKTAKKTADVVK